MANPTFNAADITVLDPADSTTDWAQTGQMGPVLDNDIFLEGTGSVGVEFKSTGVSTLLYDVTTPITIVGKHIRLWVWLATATAINTLANNGLSIRVEDSGGDWGEWNIGGSDAADWIGDGWKCVVIDCDRAFDTTSASAPTLTDIQFLGVGFDVVNTLGKSNGLVVDNLMISAAADTTDATGGVLEITSPEHVGASDLDFNDNGGSPDTIVRPSGSWITDGFELGDTIVVSATSSNNIEMVITAITATTLDVATGTITDEQNTSGLVIAVVTLQDIVTKDQVTDDSWYGHIHKDKNGSFEFTGKLLFGDFSGGLNTIIRDTNQTMIWADNGVDTTQYQIAIVEDTGTTEVVFGTEVGTGNDSKGVGGGLMKKNEEVFTFDYTIKASDASPVFEWFGGTIDGCSGGLNLAQTDIRIVSCVVSNSAQIILSTGAEMREGFITDSLEPSGVGAILLNANPTDPEFRDMTLINNIHAIENETNGPIDLDLRNIKFAGNTADVRHNGTGVLTVNVLEGGDTPSTSVGGGGSVVVVNSVTLTVTVVEAEDFVTLIVGARVGIHLVSDNSEVMNEVTNGSGVATTTFAFVSNVDVFIRVRDEDERYVKIPGTITNVGLTVTAAVDDDDQYTPT